MPVGRRTGDGGGGGGGGGGEGRGGLMMSGPCLAWSSTSEHSRITTETTSKTNRDSLMPCP